MGMLQGYRGSAGVTAGAIYPATCRMVLASERGASRSEASGRPNHAHMCRPRAMPCGAIAQMAIADQPGLACPEEVMCRTSQGWFVVAASLLLLPHCDAFQVWPLHLVQAAPPPSTLSLLRQTSGSDHFGGSLEPTDGAERVYRGSDDGQAVVIRQNGLVYVPTPGYADQDSIRSSALFAYLGPSGLGIEYGGVTHFARVLPPLPDLPAVQFVAGCCEGHTQPVVVDLRALHGY